MIVTLQDNGIALITMTTEELDIIRYALNEGVEKMESTARFAESLDWPYLKSTRDTADRAKAANNALEAAVQEYLQTKTVGNPNKDQ